MSYASRTATKIQPCRKRHRFHLPSEWRKRLQPSANPDRKTWEIAVLFALRDAFRTGDALFAHSHLYRDIARDLIPATAVPNVGRLAVPLDAAS